MSPVEVSIRTFFVAAIGISIVILFGRYKQVGTTNHAPTKAQQLPTEAHRPVEKEKFAKIAGKLLGGAVITGALLAFILAIFLAFLVSTITEFLK